jgi:hypothetical protein
MPDNPSMISEHPSKFVEAIQMLDAGRKQHEAQCM